MLNWGMAKQVYKILIVDDNPDVVELIKESLDLIDTVRFEFIVCDNGQLGYIRAKEHLPNLIFLDVKMPRWDGYQAYENLMANDATSGIPVVFITALHEKDDILKAKTLKIKHYIVKPFDIETIIKKTKEILGIA